MWSNWFRLSLAGFLLLLAAVLAYLERRGGRFGGRTEKRSGVYRYTTGSYSNLMFLGLMGVVLHVLYFVSDPGMLVQFLHGELMLLFNLLLLTVLLLALMPRLRRRFSAQSCAELWLIPASMCYFSLAYRLWQCLDPVFVIRISRPVLLTAFRIWLAGFCGVLLWKVLSHLCFRKRVLQSAARAEPWEYGIYAKVWQALVPPAESVYRNFYEREICRPAELLLDFRHILRSPAVSSPLTVGLRKKSIFLLLPDRAYSEDELEMIFRHEIIHLLRKDTLTKFFLTLLCAAGWFIPSLWCGRGFVSEDLELCCDEMVTEGMGKDRRKDYAGLLLQASGTERGFTSCLSVSARGFRYRLKRVLHPRRRKAGRSIAAFVGALFVVLLGTVGIQEKLGTVQTAFFDEGWELYTVRFSSQEDACADPAVLEAVEDQMRSLKLESPLWKNRRKTSDYDIPRFSPEEVVVILARGDGERMLVELYPNIMVVSTEEQSKPTVYLTDGTLDLSLLLEPVGLRKMPEEGRL